MRPFERLPLQVQPLSFCDMSRVPQPQDQSSAPDASAEAREYDAFALAQDPLDIEAATWVVRQRNGLDAQGEAELQAWLGADPRRGPAFEDMAGTLGEVKHLLDRDVSTLKTALRAHDVGHAPLPEVAPKPTRRPNPMGRRPWLPSLAALLPQAAGAAIVLAVVGGGWMGWEHWRGLATFESSYATARGQQLSVQLPDGSAGPGAAAPGSRLQLDTVTDVDAILYRDRRTVRLKDGQAMFTVQADAQRPFIVWAGPLRITVVGTRFSVRHVSSGLDAGQTVVSVEEGRVRVARMASPDRDHAESRADTASAAHDVLLTGGQMVTADAAGQLGPVGSVSPAAVATWRDGRLNFDQTPLAQAIAEFERYGHTGLVVRDPAVASLPVGGSYNLRQWQRFAESLPQVLPVRLINRGDVTEVVAR